MTREELGRIIFETIWKDGGFLPSVEWSDLAPHTREFYANAAVKIREMIRQKDDA